MEETKLHIGVQKLIDITVFTVHSVIWSNCIMRLPSDTRAANHLYLLRQNDAKKRFNLDIGNL